MDISFREELISEQPIQGSIKQTEVSDLLSSIVVNRKNCICDYQDNRQRNIQEADEVIET